MGDESPKSKDKNTEQDKAQKDQKAVDAKAKATPKPNDPKKK
jgi:hypothetical protein